jgi:transmembrane sensor
MDYTKFTIEDLASNERFIDWVNMKDPEAEKFWIDILTTYPEMKSKIDKARALVINLKRAEDTRQDLRQIESMWQNIQSRVDAPETVTLHGNKRSIIRYFLAASVVLILGSLGTWYAWNLSFGENQNIYSYQRIVADYIEQVNETGSPLQIHLNDGSTVSLENKSRLKYKRAYDKDSTRDVYLLGGAFFEVAKNPYKPFIVHTNEIVTEVLGTSFRVQAHEKNVVVSVKTGKVSVYALQKEPSPNDKKNGVILLPNQQVSYEREQQSFDKKLVDIPELIIPSMTNDKFTFENTPIKEVFKTLESAYGIEILYNEERMINCFLTAPLGSEPLFEKLKIICQTIGARYEIIDTKVVISSSGC